jgi:BTB/POZ domain-containing protein 3/6
VEIDADTVVATLYAAKKYITPYLATQCVRFLETSLDAKNACLLLSQSRLFEEETLTNRCLEVIDAQTEEALHSDAFLEVDHDTLQTIFNRETLNIRSELSLLEAAVRWADEECIRCHIPPTNENRRAKIGRALYNIRFPAMRLQDFADGPAQSSILSSAEICDLFLHFTSQRKPQLLFPTKPRKGLQSLRCHRFQSCAYRSNQWRYRGRCDSIQFTVDSRIFLIGFGLYGSSNGTAEYKVALELKKSGHVLAKNNVKIFTDGSNSTFPVHFEHPVLIKPSTLHMASVVIDGSELSYFGQEGQSETVEAGVTFQFVCSPESTNGTGVQGGQIPEFIFFR